MFLNFLVKILLFDKLYYNLYSIVHLYFKLGVNFFYQFKLRVIFALTYLSHLKFFKERKTIFLIECKYLMMTMGITFHHFLLFNLSLEAHLLWEHDYKIKDQVTLSILSTLIELIIFQGLPKWILWVLCRFFFIIKLFYFKHEYFFIR